MSEPDKNVSQAVSSDVLSAAISTGLGHLARDLPLSPLELPNRPIVYELYEPRPRVRRLLIHYTRTDVPPAPIVTADGIPRPGDAHPRDTDPAGAPLVCRTVQVERTPRPGECIVTARYASPTGYDDPDESGTPGAPD